MRFYETSFFCDEGEGVEVKARGIQGHWPIIVSIVQKGKDAFSHPCVTMYMHEQDWINFKNSVIQTHEQYLRNKKEGKDNG